MAPLTDCFGDVPRGVYMRFQLSSDDALRPSWAPQSLVVPIPPRFSRRLGFPGWKWPQIPAIGRPTAYLTPIYDDPDVENVSIPSQVLLFWFSDGGGFVVYNFAEYVSDDGWVVI